MEENLKYQNYKGDDGSVVKKCINKNLSIKNSKNTICKNCENENNSESNYCKFCGYALSNIENNNIENKIKGENFDISLMLHQFNLRSIMKTSLSSILILFIMSTIFKLFVSIGLGDFGKFVNPIHIIMGLNLGYLDVNSANVMGSGSMTAHLGVLLLLMGPVIAVIISNILFMRNKNKSAKDVLLSSLGVGIVYGSILFVLSILSGIKINFNGVLQYGVALEISYRPFSIFINGFIISFLTTYIFNFKKMHENENIYLTILKKAVGVIFIGCITVFVILIAITLTDRSYLYELGMYGYIDKVSIGLILSQLSVYMWGFANFIPVTMSNTSISIFSLLGSDLFLDTKLIFGVMITLGALIIIVNGCNLKRKYKDSSVNVVFMFSIYYSILMGILALVSSIIIGGNISLLETSNYQGSIILGIPVLGSMISGFIYSFILTFAGYKLYVFEDNSKNEKIL